MLLRKSMPAELASSAVAANAAPAPKSADKATAKGQRGKLIKSTLSIRRCKYGVHYQVRAAWCQPCPPVCRRDGKERSRRQSQLHLHCSNECNYARIAQTQGR